MAARAAGPRALDEARLLRREARAEQTYALFLKDLCQRGRMSREFAERAAVAVICTLEARLTRDEARDLEAQLPLKLQNLLYQCDRPAGLLPEKMDRQHFLDRVGDALGIQGDEAEPIVRAVFGAVRDHVSEGELDDVLAQLPHSYSDLWHRPI